MGIDPFLQSDGETLKNRLGIRDDPEALAAMERELVSCRAETLRENVAGDFDTAHLRAIHHHLFQDIFEWAGTMRSDRIILEGEAFDVPACIPEFAKGSSQFLPSRFVARGMAEIERRAQMPDLFSPDPVAFSVAAAALLGALNHVHPFREGNGRAQRAFVEQLAHRAGHDLDYMGVTAERMVEACIDAEQGDDLALEGILLESLLPARVGLRLHVVEALEKAGVDAQGFWIETAVRGRRIAGTLLPSAKTHVTIVTDENRLIALAPDALPAKFKAGDHVNLVV